MSAVASGLLSSAFAWHRTVLQTHPLSANACQSGFLMLFGDRAAQAIEAQRRRASADAASSSASPPPRVSAHEPTLKASWVRTGILTLWSACVSAPFYTLLYKTLHHRLPGRPALWVVINATIPAPLFSAAFFSVTTAAEHVLLAEERAVVSPDAIRAAVAAKLQDRWLETVLLSAQIWMPVNYVNFRYVPLHYRMLFGGLFALLWSGFLSLQQHNESAHPDGQAAAAGGRSQGVASHVRDAAESDRDTLK